MVLLFITGTLPLPLHHRAQSNRFSPGTVKMGKFAFSTSMSMLLMNRGLVQIPVRPLTTVMPYSLWKVMLMLVVTVKY
jgi:hypothetical protein